MFEGIERMKSKTVVQETVERLKEVLFSSDLKKGEKLPTEKELCERLAVGRNSLREALRILDSTGYISLEPGRGAFALRTNEFQEEDNVLAWFQNNKVEVRDYMEVRFVCEPLATRLAIERCTPRELYRLHTIHSAFLSAIEEKDIQAITIQEGRFHDSIIEMSKNQLLINIFKILHTRTVDFRNQSLRLPGGPKEAIKPHARILRAFELGDSELGEIAMREHVRLGIQNYEMAMLDAELESKAETKPEE